MLGLAILSTIFAMMMFVLLGMFLMDDEKLSFAELVVILFGFLFLASSIVASVQYGRDTALQRACPVCEETYDQDMNYCPIDGHELVLER